MDTRQIVSSAAVLGGLFVVAVGLLYISTMPKKVSLPPNSPILVGTTTPDGNYHYTANQPYYTVDITYPSSIPLSPQVTATIQGVMEKSLSNDINLFRKENNLDALTAEDIQVQGLGPDKKYAFSATYKMYQSTSTVSYVFTVFEDTLGAHPNTFFKTFTFNENGTQLQLADLFKKDAGYLPELSKLAYARVVKQLKNKIGNAPTPEMLDMVRIGTEPTPEALQFFYIDKNVLHLLFPPYQVAAYALGSFDVSITRAELSAIVR